jgi:hypothetical protein
MNRHEAIYKLYPNVKYINNEIAYDANDNVVAIDEPLVQIEIDKVAYIARRQAEYPPLAEQLDYIYHNGVEAWKADMILPVKNKYPKGSE